MEYDVVSSYGYFCYFVDLVTLFQRPSEASRRLLCSVATEPLSKQVEESKMDAPKEIFLKDYKSPDYYFDTVYIAIN